jgi:hypothetical protein
MGNASVNGNGREPGTMSDLKGKISSASEAAKEKLSSTMETLKDQASDLIEPVKDKAVDMAERQKETGTMQIDRVARVVHAAADTIEKEIPQAAGYIHSAAKGLEDASSAIQSRSVGEIVEFVEDFARRNPAAFFGSTVLAGFVLSRFLKSSSGRVAAQRSSTGAPGA